MWAGTLPIPFRIGDVVAYAVQDRMSESDEVDPRQVETIITTVQWQANGHFWQYGTTHGAWFFHEGLTLVRQADEASLREAILEEEKDFERNG